MSRSVSACLRWSWRSNSRSSSTVSSSDMDVHQRASYAARACRLAARPTRRRSSHTGRMPHAARDCEVLPS
jgi:hypothetical protein